MEMPIPNQDILARKAQIVERLQSILPDAAVIHTESQVRAYECDALTAYKCPPLCAVLPTSTQEVAAVLKIWASLSCRAGLERLLRVGLCRRRIA
jgi:glycolate oxidase